MARLAIVEVGMTKRIAVVLSLVMLLCTLFAGTTFAVPPKHTSGVQPAHIECQYTAWYQVEGYGQAVTNSQWSVTMHGLWALEDTTDRGYCGEVYSFGAYTVYSGCHTIDAAVLNLSANDRVDGAYGGTACAGTTNGQVGSYYTSENGGNWLQGDIYVDGNALGGSLTYAWQS